MSCLHEFILITSKPSRFNIFVRLGHPLSCVLEWVIAKSNELSANNVISFSSVTAPVFVSPDESYLIFCSTRKNGLGRGDLYISFKEANGKWGNAINMGPAINTSNYEYCPFVTKDGKYLFYTSNQDIYWVSATITDEIKAAHYPALRKK